MKSIFEFWPEIAARILERKYIFLALDYDGVLAPIAAQPDLAKLAPINRKLLEQLIECPRVRAAIISGRSLSDVRSHVGIAGIIYAGNHGAEIDLNGALESHIGLGGYREELIEIRKQLEQRFTDFPGILVEDKGVGIGLHYREVEPARLEALFERFATWARNLPSHLQIVHAKKMYEIRPRVAWNKGLAVVHVWQAVAPNALPICLGDDLTDEDGFQALLGKGINVYVGEERQSYAEYILHAQSEVGTFLARLLTELTDAQM